MNNKSEMLSPFFIQIFRIFFFKFNYQPKAAINKKQKLDMNSGWDLRRGNVSNFCVPKSYVRVLVSGRFKSKFRNDWEGLFWGKTENSRLLTQAVANMLSTIDYLLTEWGCRLAIRTLKSLNFLLQRNQSSHSRLIEHT